MFNWWRKLAHLRHIRTEGLLKKISLTFWLKNMAYDIGPEVLNFYNCEAQVDLFGPLQYHKPIFF